MLRLARSGHAPVTPSLAAIGCTGRTHRLAHEIQIVDDRSTLTRQLFDCGPNEWLAERLNRVAHGRDGGRLTGAERPTDTAVARPAGQAPRVDDQGIVSQGMRHIVQVREITRLNWLTDQLLTLTRLDAPEIGASMMPRRSRPGQRGFGSKKNGSLANHRISPTWAGSTARFRLTSGIPAAQKAQRLLYYTL